MARRQMSADDIDQVLTDPIAISARTDEIGEDRSIDYDAAGTVIGFELIGVSHHGINLAGVPRADEIAAALRAIPHPV